MTTRLSKKDIIVSSLVLGLVFVIIPAILYGWSTVRMNSFYNDGMLLIAAAVDAEQESILHVVEAGNEEDFVTRVSAQQSYTPWQRLNETTRQFPATHDAIDQACDDLESKVNQAGSKFKVADCSFSFSNENKIITAKTSSYSSEPGSSESVLDGFPSRALQTMVVEKRASSRNFTYSILSYSDPVVVLKITLQNDDY